MNILELTSAQLKQAADIKDQIEALEKQLAALTGSGTTSAPVAAKRGRPRKIVDVDQFVKPAKRKMSAAGRAAIIAAQKLRWARIKAAKGQMDSITAKPEKRVKKRTMSAAGRAAIIAAQKLRWSKIKASKKG